MASGDLHRRSGRTPGHTGPVSRRQGQQPATIARLMAGTTLSPGTYWVAVTATNAAGDTSAVQTAKFWITRG